MVVFVSIYSSFGCVCAGAEESPVMFGAYGPGPAAGRSGQPTRRTASCQADPGLYDAQPARRQDALHVPQTIARGLQEREERSRAQFVQFLVLEGPMPLLPVVSQQCVRCGGLTFMGFWAQPGMWLCENCYVRYVIKPRWN